MQPGVLSVSREQFAQQLLLRGFVAREYALELLAQLGGLVSSLVDSFVRTRARIDELGEPLLHGRVALPARNGGSQVQVLPFGMVARLALQLGKALEQIVNEAPNTFGALVVPWPVEHGQNRRNCNGLDLAAVRDERGIVVRLELSGDVVFLETLGQRHRQKLVSFRPLGLRESV